jgi:hypothetical protein
MHSEKLYILYSSPRKIKMISQGKEIGRASRTSGEK